MSPIATSYMANGRNIVIELLPESALNIASNFIYIASRGYLDHHAVKRIVPGNWMGISHTTSGKKECRYLIPSELELNPDVIPLDSHPGAVRMGDYGETELAGCRFFLPLRDCPDHKGIYPVLGHVLEDMDELYRLEKVETVPVADLLTGDVEVNYPVKPEIIERVELEPHGEIYPEPVKVREPEFPECWKQPYTLTPYPARYLSTFPRKYLASPGVL